MNVADEYRQDTKPVQPYNHCFCLSDLNIISISHLYQAQKQSLLNTLLCTRYMAILIPCTSVHGQFISVYMCTSSTLCTRYIAIIIPCTSVPDNIISVYMCTTVQLYRGLCVHRMVLGILRTCVHGPFISMYMRTRRGVFRRLCIVNNKIFTNNHFRLS